MNFNETFANKVIELSSSKLGGDLGKAVRTELEPTLKNLGGGIARKLHAQLGADDKDRNPEEIAALETALAKIMATKIVDRIILPDLDGVKIIAAPKVLRSIAADLGTIDEVALGKITSKEILEVVTSTNPSRRASATQAKPADAPKAAPKPRPQARPSSSSSGSWSGPWSGSKGRSGGK